MAVGDINGNALIEHWNGHLWTLMTGTPNESSRDYLFAVSCADTRSCVAVGDTSGRTPVSGPAGPSTTRTLVEHWHGAGAWSIMTGTPSPTRFAQLLAVSCPSATSCFAIGQVMGRSWHAVAEHWNGRGAWSIMTGALARNGQPLDAGISCPSIERCFAANADGVARWNGHGGWQLTASPTPAYSTLRGMTCISPTNCFVVGAAPDERNTLIEHYA